MRGEGSVSRRTVARWVAALLLFVASPVSAWDYERISADEASESRTSYAGALEADGSDARRQNSWGLVRVGVGVGAARSVVRYRDMADSPTGDVHVRDGSFGCCAASITGAIGRGAVGAHATVHGYVLPARTDEGMPASIEEGRPAVLGVGLGATFWLIEDLVWMSPTFQLPWLVTVVAVASVIPDDEDDEGWARPPEDEDTLALSELPLQVGFDLTMGIDLPVTDSVAVGAAIGVGGFNLALPGSELLGGRQGMDVHGMMTLTFR